MSREIKFRAWDGETMLTNFDSVTLAELQAGVVQDGNEIADQVKVIVMQFTGLKDKNGKEIWEGDVIENPGYSSGEVIFGSGRFYCTSGFEWGEIDPECKVLGNIYENPELLTEREMT